MSYTTYHTTICYSVDVGEFGSHDLEFDYELEVDDDWIAEQALEQDLVDRHDIANDYINGMSEDERNKYFLSFLE